jgi:septal ring factor EnvC (AmiA/AmiB activator)
MSRHLIAALSFACFLAALAPPAAAQAPGQEQKALDRVRERIETLGKRVSQKHAQRTGATAELRRVELELGATAQKLTEAKGLQAAEKRKQDDLVAQIAAAEGRLGGQRETLAQQIRLSYMGGRQEALRLLLNQESPARLGRMMVYYDYLNRARSAEIEKVNNEINQLAQLSAEARQVTRELARLAELRKQEAAQLETARIDRRRALAQIDQELKSADSQMASLKAEENALLELLEELREVLAAFPVESQARFASLKGQLAWPLRGRVLRDYGARKTGGGLTATGVLLAAAAGSPVRALYHGRVVFGDWLPGLGLLLVVDHGEGYMSLYGHNEALLKEAGDWVTPGEVIAQVGDSGGQSEPALYFEIRREGVPENPRRWISRQIAGGP